MKSYIKPEVRISYFRNSDVIVTSNGGCFNTAGSSNKGHGTGQDGCGQSNGKGYYNSGKVVPDDIIVG